MSTHSTDLPVSDRPLWHLKFQDPTWSEPRKYVFDPRELLTVSALRQIKQWFPGTGLGKYLTFVSEFSQGDPEGALCAIWLCRKAAGEENVPEPNAMPDFKMGEFYDFFQATGEADPTQAEAEGPTPASTLTRTSSETDTSDS